MPPLGTVTVVGDCTAVDATCQRLEVTCEGLDPIEVDINVYEPTAPVQGTVLFGTGGSGTGFYLLGDDGADLRARLGASGYRLVDRKWAGEGWYVGTPGLRFASCRYATLLQWLHDNVHDVGGFCATGNSGGSAEIGYALTRWGAEGLLDLAIPSGGPAVTRLDYVCLGQDDPTWQALCAELIPDGVYECGNLSTAAEPGGPACTFVESHTVCQAADGSDADAAAMLADSVAAPDADYDYGSTVTRFLYGVRDCDQPNVASAHNWATAVTSPKQITYVPNTPHGIMTTVEGRDAIIAAIEEECHAR